MAWSSAVEWLSFKECWHAFWMFCYWARLWCRFVLITHSNLLIFWYFSIFLWSNLSVCIWCCYVLWFLSVNNYSCSWEFILTHLLVLVAGFHIEELRWRDLSKYYHPVFPYGIRHWFNVHNICPSYFVSFSFIIFILMVYFSL